MNEYNAFKVAVLASQILEKRQINKHHYLFYNKNLFYNKQFKL